jgi:hypothetical protein
MSTACQSGLNPYAKIYSHGETRVLTMKQYNDKQRANSIGLQYKEDLDSLIGTEYQLPGRFPTGGYITGTVYGIDYFGNLLGITNIDTEDVIKRADFAKYALCEDYKLLPSCYLVLLTNVLDKKFVKKLIKKGYTRKDLLLKRHECIIKLGMTRVLLEERIKNGYSKTSIHPGILYDSFTIPLNLVDNDPDKIQRSLIEKHLFNFLLPYVVREPPIGKCEWLIVNKSLLSDPGFKTAWYNFKQKYGLL